MWNYWLDAFTCNKPQELFDCGRIAKTPAQILEEHESYILELQEEKEKQEVYEIVLWWGLDGLKIKDDGMTEWISRRKQRPKPDVGLAHEGSISALVMKQVKDLVAAGDYSAAASRLGWWQHIKNPCLNSSSPHLSVKIER